MDKDIYLTQAPVCQTPQTIYIPQKEKINTPKSLSSPNDRRNQVSKKMLSNFPLQGYYDDKKIKPGISLYKTILQTQDRRKQGQFKGPYLQMNIHPTVAFTDNVNSMIFCQNGIISTQNYISYQHFLSKIGYTQKDLHKMELHPCILTKTCNNIAFQHAIIMNNQVASKVIPRSQNSLTTKFIQPFAMYPNIIRLFFTPKSIKTVKKNIGYKVINRKQMTQQVFKKKHRLPNHYLVNVDNQETYIATLIKGKALQSTENMVQSLCDYLEHALLIKVLQIAVDFIVDNDKVIYFHDIKSIKSKNKTKLWEIGGIQDIQKIAKQNNNQIICRLCGMLYTKHQMEKLVTNKLIYELAAHLQNRGKKLLNIPHVKKQGLSNVCHLCYELIKSEYTLINVERQFAKLMNIRQSKFERVQSKENKPKNLFFYDEEDFQVLGQKASNYKKWRLFFYLQKIKRIPQIELDTQNIQVSLEMKFQNQKEKFNKVIKNQNYIHEALKNRHKSGKGSFYRCQSSKSSYLRNSPVNPSRQKIRNTHHYVNVQSQYNKNQVFSYQIENPIDKNKSFFNDQTTCITHSQSYFSNSLNDKTRQQNPNNITGIIQNNFTKMINDLSALDEEPHNQEEQDYEPILNKITQNKKMINKHNNSKQQMSHITQNSMPPIPVQKVKMFVFYTKNHQNDGRNILSQQQLQFTLTFNNSHKFTGNSSTLKCLKNKQNSQRHSLQIYLFEQNNGLKYCNLELTVGMICDGIFQDEGLNLQKQGNLYWGQTYGCQPLPDQWMQVFTNGEQVPKCNPEKVLQNLQANDYRTSPPKVLQTSGSINYAENFMITMNRPLSSNINLNSVSSTNLKKTSVNRCKTAIQKKGNITFMAKNQLKTRQSNIDEKIDEQQKDFVFDI